MKILLLALIFTASQPALALASASAGSGALGNEALESQDPLLLEADYEAAFELLDAKDPAGAAAVLLRLTERYPEHPSLAFHLAFALFEADDPAAFEAAQRADQLKPGDPDSLYLLVLIHSDAGRLEACAKAFERMKAASALSGDPRIKELLKSAEEHVTALGEMLHERALETVARSMDTGELVQAEAALEPLLAAAKGDPDVQYHLGLLRYQQTRWEEAVEAFGRALKGLGSARYMLALSLEELGREGESREHYLQLLKSDDVVLIKDVQAALDNLKDGDQTRRFWSLDSLGGYDSNPTFLASRTAANEAGGDAIAQLVLAGSRQLWRRGGRRLLLSGLGDFWSVLGNGEEQAVFLAVDLGYQQRQDKQDFSLSLGPALQSYADRVLTQGLNLRGSSLWSLTRSWRVELLPSLYVRTAPEEQDAYLAGWGGELALGTGWYLAKGSRRIDVSLQFYGARHQSDDYSLDLGTEQQTWNSSAWTAGPRLGLFWQPRVGHSLTVDLELAWQDFDDPEQVQWTDETGSNSWSKDRVDHSTTLRVGLRQKLWRSLHLTLQGEVYGRESTVGASDDDLIDRGLSRHYIGLGLSWQQAG